ncbi:protein kinase domain-containing protein [Gordonia desulfuricans]|uniref:protein kinase domain-containing protein n=1 Tax=Gordonia desulfuricans TaxID=89051 RepID=UPI000ADDA6E2|nr:NERD domain-containing protein [Gordonia desulfuricans]
MVADDRWIEVSKSAYAHEADGLKQLRDIVPPAPPYRAWTNFEFMDNHGGWNEIDALILGRRRLHMVELKSWNGVLSGNEKNWVLTGRSRKSRTQRSALLTTRHKAQKLASRLKDEVRKVALENQLDVDKVMRHFPFIQEEVFFHGDEFTVNLSDLAKSNLFGIDGREAETGLPGITGRLLEPPVDGRDNYGEDMSVILALALRELGASRRLERDAGSWTITGNTLDSGDDWQDFDVVHKVTGVHGRGRIVTSRRGAPAQARAAARRRIQREYELIRSFRQESIVPPLDLAQDDDGNAVLVYEKLDDFQPLDLALLTREVSVEQQIEILTQVADALAYAHRNQVSNRGLSPSTVLINTARLDDGGDVQIRLADWSWAGRIHRSTSASATVAGSAIAGSTGDEDVYQAPEDRWSPTADRIAVDVFSLGALAYFVFTGEAPARDRTDLRARLRIQNGLDLAASGGRFVDESLRAVVLQATRPSVSDRVKLDVKFQQPHFGAAEFRTELQQYTVARGVRVEPEPDPLNPLPDDELADGRFTVVKLLGAGSTARGVLVLDNSAAGERRVLKVGLDDSKTARLYDEAEVLTKLGQQQPTIPGVVELLEPPLHLGGRTALLLSDCGEQTLSDIVRHMAVSEAQLKLWGTQLLDTVVALDAAGIVHRDIKPSNLGMAKTPGTGKTKRPKTSLALFDFSLSRAGVTETEAGTPTYRDPFLGMGKRTAFDSAAERYSAAVVLYEMATGSTPVYGDGRSDPTALTDDVTIDVEAFTDAGLSQVRADALAGFFRTALARDARKRHDTATAMLTAWKSVFTARADEAASTEASRRGGNGPSFHPTPVIVMDQRPDVSTTLPPYTSLPEFVRTLTDLAGRRPTVMRRQVLELLLGTHAESPADPFVTYNDLAVRVHVTPGRVAQIFGEFSSLLHTDDPVKSFPTQRTKATIDDLYQRALSLITASGGVSTPELLARELVGDMQIGDLPDVQRVALGVLRVVLACAPKPAAKDTTHTDHVGIEMVRRHGAGTVAMLATSTTHRRLPTVLADAANDLISGAIGQGTALVTSDDAALTIRTKTASALGLASPTEVEVPLHVLLAIAVTSSTEVGLTSLNELHASNLPVDTALRVVLQGLSTTDTFGRAELETRLLARFPMLKGTLPRRPALDDLVARVAPGMAWDDARARYRFPVEEEPKGSTVPTYRTLVPSRVVSGDTRSQVLHALGAGDRRFRALGIPLGHSDAVADTLCEHFGATRINATDVILATMRERAAEVGLDWSMILAADAGAAADQEGLRGFVAQAVPSIVDAVAAVDGPVVLTDLSTLAAYGQLGIVRTWTDLTDPPPHSVWATIPQPHTSGQAGPLVDGVALPLNSPEQFIPLTDDDVTALVAAAAIVAP